MHGYYMHFITQSEAANSAWLPHTSKLLDLYI